MIADLALAIALLALVALVGFRIALRKAASRLFVALDAMSHGKSELSKWPWFGDYDPLPPKQMAYLYKRRFEELADPVLYELGQRSRTLFFAYIAAFFVMFFSLLLWSFMRAG